ncbi:site-2 protease family protein [Emticicia sp. CRIBPO]|uniref:site-2 protease family protein n=1 Tax=Emticicia sp. CRIBPO TaxID=2683258 RepID=UPI00141313D9|nr:site-2 protease family protein [Emticicia sp. CRIBPO]NBA84365.1 site-2 protease family protein [Emticicia sp. CRIBPO]
MNKPRRIIYIQLSLFIITLITTTLAGAEWTFGKSFFFHSGEMGWNEFKKGFLFSIPFLGFLTTHEFGHYFMAKYRKIKVTLPYYIPIWLVIFTTIGTMGAFIRIKEKVRTKNDYFDIGIAGPLAGFVVTVAILIYGFANLPTDEYVFSIHPEYFQHGADYRAYLENRTDAGEAVVIGKSILFQFLESTFADPSRIPHDFELTHYPFLLAGFLGLFFTALNLIPIGQLDGGHILFGLIGKKAFDIVSPVFLVILVTFSGLGMFRISDFGYGATEEAGTQLLYFLLFVYFNYLCFSRISEKRMTNWALALAVVLFQLLLTHWYPQVMGYSGFLAFGFLIGRVLGVYHPPTEDVRPLGWVRVVLGWLTLGVFILCFSPYPIN